MGGQEIIMRDLRGWIWMFLIGCIRPVQNLTNLMMVSGDNLGFARVLGMCKMLNHNILLAQPEDSPRRCSDCSSPLEGLTLDGAQWKAFLPEETPSPPQLLSRNIVLVM